MFRHKSVNNNAKLISYNYVVCFHSQKHIFLSERVFNYLSILKFTNMLGVLFFWQLQVIAVHNHPQVEIKSNKHDHNQNIGDKIHGLLITCDQ